jgi:hypothetical protein
MGRRFTTDRLLVRFFPHFVGVVVFGQALWAGPGVAQPDKHLFDLLPTEVQRRIVDARNACIEEHLSMEDGLQTLFVDKDTRLIVVDWGLAACHGAGMGGCSNRGCMLQIFAGQATGSWRSVFEEEVNHYSFDTFGGDFNSLTITLVGGNSQCKGRVQKGGDPHRYCTAVVTWRDGRWQWKPVR